MKYQSAQNLSFRQINIFLSAARHENLTKAAEELFLTQATVTRNIQEFESLLGISLFIRKKKRVQLTEAGKALAEDLELLCARLDSILDRVYEQPGEAKVLNIGDFSSVRTETYLLPITEMFEQQHPDIELHVRREIMKSLLDGVLSGQLDVAFVAGGGEERYRSSGVEWEKIIHIPPCAVISKGNPYYDKETITVDDLSRCTLISMRDEAYSEYVSFITSVCSEVGIRPSMIRCVANEMSITTELKRGPCFAIVDSMYTAEDPDCLRKIALPPCSIGSGVAIIWSKENENPSLPLFLECIRELEDILNASMAQISK